ncbi:MAG TPA: GNAT family N-acetyltransferase [Actinophytocola sp.]|uniref:GNAT family N-acetyltransferase n=1 Tax=Actinophytocola sp. TaxID=1872138 RepID=UPI002DDCCBBF|nr:GNAT family N-acetyltransferase [Actinophytocola sp.]HEV2782303.1 GNAT family N-acetyltransferase [Actinophytocola sp.]
MGDLVIRPAEPDDVGALAEALGQAEFFAEQLAMQANGRGILLTAWKNGQPKGDVYLRLEPAEEPEIRHYLPDVPLLTHLEVLPGDRNRGIGTKLIKAAERLLHDLKYRWVALAVEVTNVDASRLYRRLGYRSWNRSPVICYTWLANGRERRPEICNVLVKRLDARQ